MSRRWRFFVGFGLVALALAGGLSYLADSDPDGLDSVTRRGCTVTGSSGDERLEGTCIAERTGEHPLARWPFAGYAIGGDGRLTGVAGVLGVLGTLAVAGGLFRLLGRRPTSAGQDRAGDRADDRSGDG